MFLNTAIDPSCGRSGSCCDLGAYKRHSYWLGGCLFPRIKILPDLSDVG